MTRLNKYLAECGICSRREASAPALDHKLCDPAGTAVCECIDLQTSFQQQLLHGTAMVSLCPRTLS